MKKYRIEKVIHEISRDLPEAEKIVMQYERFQSSFTDVLTELIRIYEEEKEKDFEKTVNKY